MRQHAWNLAYAALLVIASLSGCARDSAAPSAADAKSIRDTALALDSAMNHAVDSLNCQQGLRYIGDLSPIFVSGGHVVRTHAALLKACASMVALRSGARFVTDTVTAHAMSPNAAYVVREGEYTINFRDGSRRVEQLVTTTIWERQGGQWTMVHLHESAIPRVDSAAARVQPR